MSDQTLPDQLCDAVHPQHGPCYKRGPHDMHFGTKFVNGRPEGWTTWTDQPVAGEQDDLQVVAPLLLCSPSLSEVTARITAIVRASAKLRARIEALETERDDLRRRLDKAWRPVCPTEPPMGVNVLVALPGGVTVAQRWPDEEWTTVRNVLINAPSHWQPLPALPQGGTDADSPAPVVAQPVQADGAQTAGTQEAPWQTPAGGQARQVALEVGAQVQGQVEVVPPALSAEVRALAEEVLRNPKLWSHESQTMARALLAGAAPAASPPAVVEAVREFIATMCNKAIGLRESADAADEPDDRRRLIAKASTYDHEARMLQQVLDTALAAEPAPAAPPDDTEVNRRWATHDGKSCSYFCRFGECAKCPGHSASNRGDVPCGCACHATGAPPAGGPREYAAAAADFRDEATVLRKERDAARRLLDETAELKRKYLRERDAALGKLRDICGAEVQLRLDRNIARAEVARLESIRQAGIKSESALQDENTTLRAELVRLRGIARRLCDFACTVMPDGTPIPLHGDRVLMLVQRSAVDDLHSALVGSDPDPRQGLPGGGEVLPYLSADAAAQEMHERAPEFKRQLRAIEAAQKPATTMDDILAAWTKVKEDFEHRFHAPLGGLHPTVGPNNSQDDPWGEYEVAVPAWTGKPQQTCTEIDDEGKTRRVADHNDGWRPFDGERDR